MENTKAQPQDEQELSKNVDLILAIAIQVQNSVKSDNFTTVFNEIMRVIHPPLK